MLSLKLFLVVQVLGLGNTVMDQKFLFSISNRDEQKNIIRPFLAFAKICFPDKQAWEAISSGIV